MGESSKEVGEKRRSKRPDRPAPCKGRIAKLSAQEDPETYETLGCKVKKSQSVRGEFEGVDAPQTGANRVRSLRGQKAQESSRSRSKLIPWRQRGARLSGWDQATGAAGQG